MAIELQPDKPQQPGGSVPSGREPEPGPPRPWWRRPAVHTGIVGGVLGYFLGHWLGNLIASGYQQVQNSGQNEFAIILGYVLGTVAVRAGLGVFNDLLRQMAGRPVHADAEAQAAASGLARFFRYSLDHKVVGIQYLVGLVGYFPTGGLRAP